MAMAWCARHGMAGVLALAVLATLAAGLLVSAPTPAAAQYLFENLFGSSFKRQPRPESSQSRRARPPQQIDYSRAPPPAERETPPQSTVLVLGDSMADWLAYGLEDLLEETPELGVVRGHRAGSGLIRYEAGDKAPDWTQIARERIAKERPSFIVMMLGIHDRQSIRETPVAAPAASREGSEDGDTSRAKPTPKPQPIDHEFRADGWSEAYGARVDAMIAVLKSARIPVFWVGMPPLRGTRSTSDMSYLNEIFKERAERAGIVFVDVWDGFVNEAGRFVVQGPDVEGQVRRLRTNDGVHFTRAGARTLAHYLEREIQRVRSGPISLTLPTSEVQPGVSTGLGGPTERPLAGPVMPLTSPILVPEPLAGSTASKAPATHAVVARTLVKGELIDPPAGRADDFAWPRRSVAAFGSDPHVTTTTLPIPEMKPPPAKTKVETPNEPAQAAAPPPRRSARPPQRARPPEPPPEQRRRPFFPFFNLFR